jgi:WD40 repeat protein
VVDTGISGPVNRIIFGGDFGCNLLHDASVCSQFLKNGMKIYTMPNKSNAFVDAKNVSGNQMFVVDANVMSLPLSVGGGGNDRLVNVVNVKQRLKIGEPIQTTNNDSVDKNPNIKLVIVNHKKKTRRRYK